MPSQMRVTAYSTQVSGWTLQNPGVTREIWVCWKVCITENVHELNFRGSHLFYNFTPGVRQHVQNSWTQKSLLSGKLDVLSKLDDELIEMVTEKELDYEIEQADIIKEKIGLCIMNIDQAIERIGSHVLTDCVATGSDSSCTTRLTEDSDPILKHSGGPPTDWTDPALTPAFTAPAAGDTTLVPPFPPMHMKLPKLSIKKFWQSG